MIYRKRIADQILQEKLEAKGAVLIEGAKWCGKTTTAKQIAASILYMQDPRNVKQNRELAEINPSLLLKGPTPRLIDEWQIAPQVWDAVRFEIDQRSAFNQFVLTGSAVPADWSANSHTGTGRIFRMTMRTMSLFESEDSTGSVSLGDLFTDGYEPAQSDDADIGKIAFLICRGGWPEAVGKSERIALAQAIDYYDAVVSTDISRVDNKKRNPERAMLLMRSYARNIASQVKMEEMRKDVMSNDIDTFSIGTVYEYLNVLKQIFVIEEAPAWNPNLRSKSAIRATATRYFTDPSIATAALGLGPADLIGDLETMGLFFENLCVRDLRCYAEALGGTVYHYRDKSGLECDAVIHLRNGSYGLVEIKLGGASLIDKGAETLHKLKDKLDMSRMKAPSFLMVLVGVSSYAYMRKDGVMVVPICCLKQ